MKFSEKLKIFVKKRNLNPLNNRKKVGVILFATSIGLFFLFAGRLAYIVVGGHVAGVSLKEKTEQLYQGTSVVEAKRGTIYDRNGNPIAENSVTYQVYGVLSDTYVSGEKKLYAQQKDFNKLAMILHDNIGVTTEYALKQLESGINKDGSTKFQVEFGKKGTNINLETKQKIENAMDAAGIKGLYFKELSDRIYPNGIFSSHLIGYAVADEKNPEAGLVGKMGIESAYNKLLRGKDGTIEYQKNIYGNPLPGTVAEEKPATDGDDIYTTIDSRLQSYLETLMDKVAKEAEAQDLSTVLMKADTGEIVAMAQRPTFNPETLDGLGGHDFVWRNLLTEDSYEPGSTMKVGTVSSAITEGVFNPNETYMSGSIKIEDRTINDWDLGMGPLTMRQALAHSSNVGMVTLEQKMPDAWQKYLEKFGFGQNTYSGLDEETSGEMPTGNVVDRAMSAYGQSIGVSQMQMLKMFSAVANGGKMLQPHYISKMVNPKTGDTTVIEPQVVGQPVSEEAANSVLEYMRDVVEDATYGTAHGVYSLEGHQVSAKTGTAEVAGEDGTGYIKGNYLYSTVLIYPSEKPEYILYMTLKLPKNYNSKILSEIANPLMKRSMDLLTIEESEKETSTSKVKVADYKEKNIDTAATDVRKVGLNPIVLGSGSVVTGQSVKAGESIDPNTRIMLKTKGTVKMPDTTDWTKSELEALGKLLDVEVHIEGSGTCIQQSFDAGAELNVDSITFNLG